MAAGPILRLTKAETRALIAVGNASQSARPAFLPWEARHLTDYKLVRKVSARRDRGKIALAWSLLESAAKQRNTKLIRHRLSTVEKAIHPPEQYVLTRKGAELFGRVKYIIGSRE